MLFSVITFAGTDSADLHKTGASLKGQECEDFEWLIISPHPETPLLKDALKMNITLIGEGRGNGGEALNQALSVAKGAYILFLKAGEILAQTQTLQKLKYIIEHSFADLVYGDYWHIEEGRSRYREARSLTPYQETIFANFSSIAFSRNLIGNFTSGFFSGKNAELKILQLAVRKSRAVLYMPIPLSAGPSAAVKLSHTNGSEIGRRIFVTQLLNWGLFNRQPRLLRFITLPPAEEPAPV